MKKLAVALLLVATAASAKEVVQRGEAIAADAKTTPLVNVMKNPAAYTRDPVVVEGKIDKVCTMKGCWMQLVPEGSKQGVRVTFKDYGFFIPMNTKGWKARAAGVATVTTLSKADADHLEGDGAKLARNPDGTASEVGFVASGVELKK
ncbi:MAG TPA: DUF4920 domain-containing protein [Thermoanaerobaculia bacterium]|jgi:hypothetical protein|nr:DUF4920 domain-containing protein [Thermoanaerobaculia bacterium]